FFFFLASKRPYGLARAFGGRGVVIRDSYRHSIAADGSPVSLICAAFREVVGESVTPAENFFEAGATSLNLVQLHVLLQRHEFSTLTLLDLFTHPSPAALA
ncbi:acyl carrier protein, partial [Escherichia coli]|uniref:acyl carrier protein n=1 Tax=Escherichia coli TaxID=562 RepID=UPI00207B162D